MSFSFMPPLRWLTYTLGCMIVLLAIYTVAGDRGAVHLWRLHGEKAKLDEVNLRLQKENGLLRQRISLVRNNNFYLEKLAREELNLVRPGEIIYRFAPSDDRNKRATTTPVSPGSRAEPQSQTR
jgi:cell division protein FtsB